MFKDLNTLGESNKYIIKLIKSNKPFIITRLGIGAETNTTYGYLKNNKIDKSQLNVLSNNAGIYDTKNNEDTIKKYCVLYSDAIKNSAALAIWDNYLNTEQSFFLKRYKINSIPFKILEPFYCLDKNIIPWSNSLNNKVILIIHPFVESFKSQLKNKFKFFEDKNKYIFHANQKFVFYKSFNTAAGNYIHKDWEETYKIMCNDISKLKFDIALLGCGGYGHPLCNYIYTELNKSAIYIGGGLQLLFGVMGKRWESNQPVIQGILKKNNTLSRMIRPSKNEILKNNTNIEGGCYW